MPTNWILGNSIDSTRDNDEVKSDKFIGYLVNLEYPRCIIAVGEVDFDSDVELEFSAGGGFFFQNKTHNFQMIITEWLDDPVENAEDILDMFYSAASHYGLMLQDMAESSLVEMAEDTCEQ